ncbi:MAG: molybdenum cofactor guanylyltransferase [Caldilineaceae bacterium]
MNNFTLVINAGGQSRRMGTGKALLPVPPHGTPLIAHIAARLVPLGADRLVVVTNDAALPLAAQLPPGTIFVADAYPDTGTLGGIATGMQQAPEWALVVACDLPLVSADLCVMLAGLAGEQADGQDRWDAVVPVVDGYEEPLHALYHRRCLRAIEARLAAGQRRVISFMPDVRTLYVKEEQLRTVDPQLHSFFNTNTPEEWAEALRLLAEGPA